MNNLLEWEWYQSGISYNNRLEPSFYDLCDCNWDFFYGFQWRNAGLDDDLPQPVFNNINRFVTFFIASILANKTKVHFDSPVTLEEDDMSDNMLNYSWEEFEERVKLDWQTKNALYDGAVTGDYVGHLIFNPDKKPYNGAYSEVEGEIEFELVDPNNFYMGNPNIRNVQSQPWIQIAGRDLVENLKKEAEDQIEIQSDNDTEQQVSKYGQIELEDITSDDGKDTGKATYVITYKKKEVDGETRVFATKCTQDGYIYKDVDLGISLYPVALGNWELQRNTYHGMSFVQSAIPTQIYINRAFAMAMKHTIDTAFPIFGYDKSAMSGKSNRVGTQMGLNLKPGQRIQDIAQYFQPGNMSQNIIQIIELSNQYMRESVGANDALFGNVNPEQASGASITAASKQSGIPLENPKMNMYNWLEDIALIYFDMVCNLYGTRPVIVQDEENSRVEDFDFSTLKNTYKSVNIDVGPSSYWSELAVIQTLDNLLDRGLIEFIDYLERMPDGYIRNKQGLIDKIKEKFKVEENKQKFIESLPENIQIALTSMEPEQQAQMVAELQGMTPEEIEQTNLEIGGQQ